MHKRVIAHVDMDCFFAAAETLVNPHFRNKPLIVGGRKNSPRGVVCTANYEARKFGVKSAMPISKAVSLCPQGIFIPTTKGLYSSESTKVMSVLQSFTSEFRKASIDEAYLDITHLVSSPSDWLTVAQRIRQAVFAKTGYTCSIGVSHSRKVAKIASGYKKPHGITIVHDAKSFLAPLPLETIHGIGKKSLPKYHKLGLVLIRDLAALSIFEVLDYFGKHGLSYYRLARGEDESGLWEETDEKSISHETTFSQDVFSRSAVLSQLEKLADKVHRRCTKDFRGITLKIRYADFDTITRSKSFSRPTRLLEEVCDAIETLFAQVPLSKAVRLVGVRFDGFVSDASCQQTLDSFTTNSQSETITLIEA